MTYLPNKLLIARIAKTLKGYRSHEKNLARIQSAHIKQWIKQFDQVDRKHILIEVDNILQKRYLSRRRAKKFLYDTITGLSRYYKFRSARTFLQHCQFLQLQPTGKSQSDLLELLDELLTIKFNLTRIQFGVKSRTYSIYIDDMLCTGLTLMRDLNNWMNLNYSKSKSNKQAIVDGSTILVVCYYFLHQVNYRKKMKEVGYKFTPSVKNKIITFSEIDIDNSSTSKLENLVPLKTKHRSISAYRNKVNAQVNDYLSDKAFATEDRFYREHRFPLREDFFTSAKRRNRLEEVLLLKGIDILKASNVQKINIRPLGFSLPSERNFGFGTLCFTWRNISNNTPLVFWYSGGSFTPLFPKKEY